MPGAKRQALKMNGCAFKAPEPLKHCGSTSLLTKVVAKSRIPSCIVGVALRNQEAKSHTNVRSDPMTEEKAHVNKSIQASLDEDENILEKFKNLQEENLQLRGNLKEKDSTISRLMKITKDQAAEYNTAIELVKEHQKETERQLEKSEHLVKEKIQLLEETKQHYTKILQKQHTQHAELVLEMKKQNAVDIRNREEKIAKLRQYISDTFQEKSWERQQQMDELRRELNKFTEETHILKIKLEKELRSKR
ncbi:E3 ubiquitin-protein ligase BRE1A-like isoform X1 [Heteronotia binoei]|uniref:E3 ubiquitin-protein ligase BRE1A-like isoform X1 n=1 Tax=Heteronotia binoei TaxID=13085 RepID=UPI00292D69AF|nr:E3 ubiquitin-protein ligase BRE1A-like isoform X1 [Heteronotia binoei]XP_060105733.1 E3 ubiquitin-protein ligase BRE1A-like isoform X1 [Heteronotia binoei]XP_060105741.1 E3 ubiquitin-protein ligase BRE1A-like isoform X1 [Heteronotia binoei]